MMFCLLIVLFICLCQDEIVPSVQMHALHTAAVLASTKELVIIADGHHNDTWMKGGAEYVQKLKKFIQTHAPAQARAAL
jgi:fermentation-respiration switch protein FrsA (DUF1100 family)